MCDSVALPLLYTFPLEQSPRFQASSVPVSDFGPIVPTRSLNLATAHKQNCPKRAHLTPHPSAGRAALASAQPTSRQGFRRQRRSQAQLRLRGRRCWRKATPAVVAAAQRQQHSAESTSLPELPPQPLHGQTMRSAIALSWSSLVCYRAYVCLHLQRQRWGRVAEGRTEGVVSRRPSKGRLVSFGAPAKLHRLRSTAPQHGPLPPPYTPRLSFLPCRLVGLGRDVGRGVGGVLVAGV